MNKRKIESKKFKITEKLILLVFVLICTCTSDPNSISNTSVCGVSSNASGNRGAQCLLVGTTDYTVGNLAEVKISSDNSVTQNLLDGLDPDHLLKKIGDEVYIMARGNSNVTRIDPYKPNTDYPVLYEQSTGTNSNPYDVAALGNDLRIVALYNEGHLLFLKKNTAS